MSDLTAEYKASNDFIRGIFEKLNAYFVDIKNKAEASSIAFEDKYGFEYDGFFGDFMSVDYETPECNDFGDDEQTIFHLNLCDDDLVIFTLSYSKMDSRPRAYCNVTHRDIDYKFSKALHENSEPSSDLMMLESDNVADIISFFDHHLRQLTTPENKKALDLNCE